MEESSEQKTYLHDDVEVVLTGRTATRELRRGKTDEKVEIKPTNPLQGSWTKWVRMSDLYTIDKEDE